MASVHAISNHAHSHPPMQHLVGDDQAMIESHFSSSQKWTYLLSNHIRFANKQAYSIGMPKPDHATLSVWLEKIVTSGQCARIFVEQLALDEVSFKRIKQLCIDHQVTLINLFQQQDMQDNVIQGPW